MTDSDWWKIWFAVAVIIILILLYYLLKKKAEKPIGKPKRERIGIYIGWLVTWIDPEMRFPHASGEANMRLVYGRAQVYDDDTAESMPETFRLTYYEWWGGQRKFNPALVPEMVMEYAEHQGYPVLWCDGTDQALDLMDLQKPTLQQILAAMRTIGARGIMEMSAAKQGA